MGLSAKEVAVSNSSTFLNPTWATERPAPTMEPAFGEGTGGAGSSSDFAFYFFLDWPPATVDFSTVLCGTVTYTVPVASPPGIPLLARKLTA